MSFVNAVQDDMLAIRQSDAQAFGCPYCGYRSASQLMSCNGTAVRSCGECRKSFMVCVDELNHATIGVNEGVLSTSLDNEAPNEGIPLGTPVVDHPRQGTPSHGRPDTKPDNGGEFFRSRGVGLDIVGCFVCNTSSDEHGKYLRNIAAFVQCKAAGERVVAMLGKGAHLDYRDYEPDYLQVKLGVCETHANNLDKLHDLCSDGRITEERIHEARLSNT